MSHERDIPSAPLLRLPDMRHLVDEQALQANFRRRKVITIPGRCGMEVNMAAGRHQRAARLEGVPASPPQAHGIALDSRAEYRSHERFFRRGQRPFAAGGAWRGGHARPLTQCFMLSIVPMSSLAEAPMVSTFSGAESLSPPAKVSVISAVAPGYERVVEIEQHDVLAAACEAHACARRYPRTSSNGAIVPPLVSCISALSAPSTKTAARVADSFDPLARVK